MLMMAEIPTKSPSVDQALQLVCSTSNLERLTPLLSFHCQLFLYPLVTKANYTKARATKNLFLIVTMKRPIEIIPLSQAQLQNTPTIKGALWMYLKVLRKS